ncbi:hypothetical protein FRC14_003393 [Serendipita sp. 396]|nr:hypothetical protein FRC14_003393 [Serendipita sp. 396]KAG8866347.1 hypothetical protein FRC20_008778 [Serendipita sp. 405]
MSSQSPPSLSSLLFNALKPTPIEPLQEEYDGLEFRYARFVFRPALFIFEGLLLGFIVLYGGAYLYASYSNSRRAQKWLKTHSELLSSQFSKPAQSSSLLTDGASDMFAFSTGRRNVQSLHTVFAFLPRHDLFQLLFTYGWIMYDLRYSPNDDVTLDFRLGPSGANAPGFVWAIVDKDELISIKKTRWDLTLTKTQENQTVPKACVVMSEVADVTETILKQSATVPFLAALSNNDVLKYFKSFSITDLPPTRPTGPMNASERERHVILSFKLPSSQSEMAKTVPLVKAAFGIIDSLENGRYNIRTESVRKLKTAREELDKELLKDATEEKSKDTEDSKRAAKRRAEEERLSKLSAEQQRKAMEKEKKKALRKGTAKVRMG